MINHHELPPRHCASPMVLYWIGTACFMWAAGCSKSPVVPARTSPDAPAQYGQPTAQPAAAIPRLRPFDAATFAAQTDALVVVQTELTPALLCRSTSRHLRLFTGLNESGLGAPSWLAFSTRHGPRSFANGTALDPNGMEENWVLVWFAGAVGWTHWDSPWAVFLQHRPTAMFCDAAGLQLQFADAAGDVVLLPLYGYEKLPVKGQGTAAPRGQPFKERQTWQWSEGLRTETLMRLRYWAGATREFPIYCEDSFSVDRSHESVTFRQRFVFHSIPDDWQTPPVKVAPISPPLALAARDPAFPARFSQPFTDYGYVTPCGPYAGVEQTERYEVTLPVLPYIHETEAVTPPDTNASPFAAQAWHQLQAAVRAHFQQADAHLADSSRDSIRNAQWFAKALPYCDDATRTLVSSGLRKMMDESVFVEGGPLSPEVLETVWCYAHFSGDWAWVREHWSQIRTPLSHRAATGWAAFGCRGQTPMSSEAAPWLALARLAWRLGELDTYHYACSLFARELVHLWVKVRGMGYFRRHQPWHTLEPMTEEVYVNHLGSRLSGWQIDGPHFPVRARERHYARRWAHCHSEDVGRFFQDYLATDVRHELDVLERWSESERRDAKDAAGCPPLTQLRSLLLDEAPKVQALVPAGQFTGPPTDVIAGCLAVLRAKRPVHFERLIPARGRPSPFAPGPEREVAGPSVQLGANVQSEAGANGNLSGSSAWPKLVWPAWQTPAGVAWNFGRIITQTNAARQVRLLELNWTTQALACSRVPDTD